MANGFKTLKRYLAEARKAAKTYNRIGVKVAKAARATRIRGLGR